MNSILIPESLLHEKTYNADKYFNERFPSDYATMEANPNYSESGCGIAVTASDTENTLSIKDPADSSKELCKLTYSNSKLKFTYKKPAMVNNITMVGVGSTEKLNILDNNFNILHLNVVKKLGGSYNDLTVVPGSGHIISAFGVVTTTKPKYSTDGINWTSGYAATLSNFCYDADNSRLVGISYTGVIYTSTNGKTWTLATTTLTSSYRWTAICYGNGKYVAMAIDKTNNKRYSAYSTDLSSWTENELDSGTPMEFYNIAYGNGIFIAVSAYNSKESIDGINWNNLNTTGLNYSSNRYDVCYGNEKFIIAGTNNMLYVGKDQKYVPVDIQFSNLSNSNRIISTVCYGNGKYVCAGYNYDKDTSMYNNYFGYSYDGYKWYFVLMDQTDVYKLPKYICYFPEKDIYITTRYDGTISIISIPDAYAGGVCNTFTVEYSWSGSIPSGVTLPNPTSYTSGTTVTVDTEYTSDSIEQELGEWSYISHTTKLYSDVCYGNGKFIAVSKNYNEYVYSTDGINWTEGTMPNSQNCITVCYGNGKFVALTSNNATYVYSTDGINWTEGTMPNKSDWNDIYYGNGKYIAVAVMSSSFYSTDGINWTKINISTNQWRYGCYGNGKYIIIGTSCFAYSTDGINWTEGTFSNRDTKYGYCCYGNGKYITTSGDANGLMGNGIAYSSDGINWTEGTLPKSANHIVFYNNGIFIIIEAPAYGNSRYAYSMDGINWTYNNMSSLYSSICYGNGKFVVVGYEKFAYLTLPDTYYQFSGWNKSGTFNITSDTSISGSWSQKSKLSVTYSWTNAPTGMTSTVPVKVTGLMPNETVAVDSKYTNNTAYKDTTNKKYYKFSGWNKSGEFNITSNTSISGSWDNGKSVGFDSTMTYVTHDSSYKVSWNLESFAITYDDYDGYYYFITSNYSSQLIIARSKDFKTYETLYTKTTTNGSSSISYIFYCYEKNILIVTGYGPTIMYSTNGTTWKTGTFNGSTNGYIYIYQVNYYNGLLWAFYNNTENNTYAFITSSDGITWTLGTASSVNFNPIINTEGGFAYYYNQSDLYLYINKDLSTWLNQSKYTKTNAYIQNNTIIYAPDKKYWYIIHKEYNSAPYLQQSSDLTTINTLTGGNFASLVKSSDSICNASYFNGVFVITTFNGVMIYSTDYYNWYSFTNNFVGANTIYHANAGGKLIFKMGTSSNDYKIGYCTNAGWPNLNYIK